MSIKPSDVAHIASLSRLSVRDDELEMFGSQLSKIMSYIEKLNELDVTGVEPTSHVMEMTNVLREDIMKDSLSVDDALSNAPDRSGSFYRVPKIIE